MTILEPNPCPFCGNTNLKVGYEKGYEAGKQAAAKEILEEVFLGVRSECIDSDSGGYFFYGPFMNLMLDLKKKYEVK